MLTKNGTGKYLTKEFHEKFALGVRDRDLLTAEEIVWAEIPSDMGYGKENPDTFKIQSQPIDSFTGSTKTIDIRARKECGDGGE